MKEKTFALIKTYLKNNKAKIQCSNTLENDFEFSIFEFTIEVEDITIIGDVTATTTQEKTLNGKKTTDFYLAIKFCKNNDFVYELTDEKTFDESTLIKENIVEKGYPAVDIYYICADKLKEETTPEEVISLEDINEILENNL